MSSPRWLVMTVLLLAGAVSLFAQDQTPASAPAAPPQAPVFHAAAELVEVIVRVTDQSGRFVSGLTQRDFALSEEGQPQSIVAFNSVDLPRPAVPSAIEAEPVLRSPVASMVSTNADVADSRAFVLLLDDMLTSPQASRAARQAAREFVLRYAGPTDLVAAFSTGGRGVQTQEFTSDKARVLAAIDQFVGRRCRYHPLQGFNVPVETENDRIYQVRVAMDVIKALAGHLGSVRGRRVTLLWISEGVDYDVEKPAISGTSQPQLGGEADPASVAHAIQDAINALQRANVAVYSFDPRRLYTPEQLLPEALPPGLTEPASHPLCREANAEEVTRSIDTLREFATRTGGFAAVHVNEFGAAFDRVLDESSQYYVLGYQPTERGRDGEFRRIEVRTTRPNLRIAARPGYVASDPRPPAPGPAGVSPELAEVLSRSLPVAGLPIRVQAIPRRGADGRSLTYVVMEVDGRALQFAEKDGRFTDRLELTLLSIDSLARQSGLQPAAMDLSLTADQVQRVRTAGVRWVTTLMLTPGRHSLRVAARSAGANRTGSVFLDVNAPTYSSGALRIDGVALTSLPAALAITTGTSLVPLGLPGPPTAARAFVKGDTLTLNAEVAVPLDFANGAIELAVAPGAPGADAVLRRILTLADRETVDRPRLFTVDTTPLAAGAYVLRLTLRDGQGRSSDTALLFDVVEPGGSR